MRGLDLSGSEFVGEFGMTPNSAGFRHLLLPQFRQAVRTCTVNKDTERNVRLHGEPNEPCSEVQTSFVQRAEKIEIRDACFGLSQ